MKIKVLGSAAGGGVPQWNCNYRISRAARQIDGPVRPRTQSSIAASVSAQKGWVLFNASPDIRQQINETPALQPDADGPLRATPIAAVVLTNADVDHLAGLLTLRERQPFHLYATRRVMDVLDANPIFRVLDPAIVRRIPLDLEQCQSISGPNGETGIEVELFAVPGKVALFLESGNAEADFEADDGDTIGVRFRAPATAGTASAVYVPGCAKVDMSVKANVSEAAVLLFDGTLFDDDEMKEAGVGSKTGRRMGHLPMSGPDGSVRQLAEISVGRRIFVHINNTNPVLDETSQQRADVEAEGWEIAFDGMEIDL